MKTSWRFPATKLLLITAVSLFLTGCFGILTPSLKIRIEPDPIKFQFGDEKQDVTLKFTTAGLGSLTVDEQAGITGSRQQSSVGNLVPIEQSSVIVPGITIAEAVTIDLPAELTYLDEQLYNAELKGKTYTLIITITGSMDPIVSRLKLTLNKRKSYLSR